MSDVIVNFFILLPISLIGIWRWSMWLARRYAGSRFKPITENWPNKAKKPYLSVVTPVYNEEEKLFYTAVDSWVKAGADEIIAVIDKTNTRLIVDFSRRYTNKKDLKCRLYVTPNKGKRAALCDGIQLAKGDLIALVDSDTIWSGEVKDKIIPHFLNKKIGGVTVKQRIYNVHSIQDVLFDILLWTRYREEIPAMLGVGKVFNTLSGRTAIYRREALLNDKFDNIHNLRHEFFVKTRGISGDDKRLTHLILEQGWHIGYEPTITVYTPGIETLRKFLKQRLRWIRNSWRADSRAFARGWVLKHPALSIHNFDRFIQPFFMLLGPASFVIFLFNKIWLPAIVLMVWWIVSRLVRLFGYFRENPKRLIYLPAYIVFSYVTAVMKIYAMATLLEHNWATRWHKARLRTTGIFRRYGTVVFGTVTTILVMVFLTNLILTYTRQVGLGVDTTPSYTLSSDASVPSRTIDNYTEQPLPPSDAIFPTDLKTYEVKQGDTISSLANRWNTQIADIKRTNRLRDTDEIKIGLKLYYVDSKQ